MSASTCPGSPPPVRTSTSPARPSSPSPSSSSAGTEATETHQTLYPDPLQPRGRRVRVAGRPDRSRLSHQPRAARQRPAAHLQPVRHPWRSGNLGGHVRRRRLGRAHLPHHLDGRQLDRRRRGRQALRRPLPVRPAGRRVHTSASSAGRNGSPAGCPPTIDEGLDGLDAELFARPRRSSRCAAPARSRAATSPTCSNGSATAPFMDTVHARRRPPQEEDDADSPPPPSSNGNGGLFWARFAEELGDIGGQPESALGRPPRLLRRPSRRRRRHDPDAAPGLRRPVRRHARRRRVVAVAVRRDARTEPDASSTPPKTCGGEVRDEYRTVAEPVRSTAATSGRLEHPPGRAELVTDANRRHPTARLRRPPAARRQNPRRTTRDAGPSSAPCSPTRALEPALAQHEHRIEADFDRMLGRLVHDWDTEGP